MIINGGNIRGGQYINRETPVTDGIKLFLDSGNPVSYPGSGTSWYDLSGENYVADIQAGMTYSASNSGVFNFNGGPASYAQLGSGFNYDYSAGVTVNVWANFGTLVDPEVDGDWERLIDFGNGTPQNNIILARRYLTDSYVMDIEGINGDAMVPGDPTINWGNWAMYTMLADGTYWKLYKNGEFQSYEDNGGLPAWTTRYTNYIGKSAWAGDSLFTGSMSIIQLYTRALTEPEITQNFNFARRRYGL